MQPVYRRLGGGLCFVVASIAGCGGAKPPAAPAVAEKSAPPPAEVHEQIVPHTCAARTKLAQLIGETSKTPAPHAAVVADTPDSAPAPAAAPPAPGAKASANQVYRTVAPTTVLLRGEHGMGTGVVVDPKGFVLTNYHVAADGRKKDFLYTIDVNFGDLTSTGRMVKQEKTYEAVLVKADQVRDLALLKIKDPPPNLVAVNLAKSAPQVADKVFSIGHAGIGFLWAVKSCSIASIGERQQDSSILAGFDCSRSDPALAPKEAEAQKKSCEEQKKRMSDALLAKTQGLAIQTDCAITHGDSGGPLVNSNGEMVGLNQSISVDLATAGFHVHLDEVRDFVAKHGDEPIALLPDPWCDGGFEPTLEDLDSDGIAETLVSKGTMSLFGGYDRMSLLIDLDEDDGKTKTNRDMFNAEIGLLVTREGTYTWYDRDDDGKFDFMLVDSDNDGAPEHAYKLLDNGGIEESKTDLPHHDLSAKLLGKEALDARLGKIATVIGGVKYTSRKLLAAATKDFAIPDPILAGGTTGRLFDSDANKKPDLAFMRGAFTRGVLVDLDEDSIGSLEVGGPADDIVKSKKIDAEIAIVIEANAIWALYDTDKDSKYDLALTTTNGFDPSILVATNAWHIDGKTLTPAPDQLGRKLLRPKLFDEPRAETALRILLSDMATDEGMGSLPSPTSPRYRFRETKVKGVLANTIVEAESGTSSVMLVDVDHDTKVPPKTDIQKVVADGKFDAEVALVHRSGGEGGLDWVFYDTDNDGKFDLVLYVPAGTDAPAAAYRFKKGATALESDAAAVDGKAIRTKSAFANKAIAAKWKVLANKLFKPTAVEQ